ncbi:MAG: glucosamine-6-phosphate deaminase [Opitutae bacterium]|nr:glucosamine-6-phosphate deaminase [Opitutae bacterium]
MSQPASLPTHAASAENEQRERIKTVVHANADAAAAQLAAEIAALIRSNDAAGKPTVLGLATGSTPVRLYRQLIRLHREQQLSFKNVITFNLDEYYGLSRTHPESYWRFMHEQLFNHIDIPAGNVNVPDGMVPRDGVFASCRAYEDKIRQAGGLQLQILGIGRTGHIGFNEPGSGRDSRTRLVTLDALTRRDAARDFLGEANVPRHAITMGVGTILEARRIVLLAWGEAKARVIAEAVEKAPTESLPASFLQGHPAVSFHIDTAAASELTRIRHPWLVGTVDWTPALARRSVVWLSQQVKKPVLKLLDENYSEHGMADLLTEQGPSYGLNIRIFNEIQHTITGWPGGKPNADDTHRPERAVPHSKRVLIFSPEPADDVLGMGGTLRRLIDQGHDVTVVYQTSGNLGVPDEEATMAAELVLELDRVSGSAANPGAAFARDVRQQLAAKAAFDGDTPEIRKLKGILRRGEARAALQACSVAVSRARFLDLPFYEKGRYRQFQIGDADVAAVTALLREIKPHQIFATGQSSDPSSVPAVCFEILRRALVATKGESWLNDCRVWLYRNPEQAWEPAEIEMAVPLSPRELSWKIQAIYHHKSQRSQIPSVTEGRHESWQQAEHHNQTIARHYDALGLAEYEAIEAFQRWHLS